MKIDIDGYSWNVRYLDCTHGDMGMEGSDSRGWVFHIGELRGKDYEPKVREFLKSEWRKNENV